MSLVSDSGPLVALAKLRRLSLLKALYEDVLIPPAVQRELSAKSGADTEPLAEASRDFLQVHPTAPSAPEVERRLESLGSGEQEAIRLAHYLGVPLLIDEAKGRAAARTLGIEVIGAIGVLLDAKEANLIPRVLPMLEERRRHDYWLSDQLVAVAIRLAGEE